MKLTSKQLVVLDFIKMFIAEKGYSPTVREICAGLGLKSPATVHEHLKNLTNAGILVSNPTKSRTIELLVENEYLNKDENVLLLPIIEYNSNVSKKFIHIPKVILGDYDKKDLCVFKENKSYYIVNTNIKPFKDCLYLIIEDNTYKVVDTINKDKLYGIVIGKIKMFI